MSRFDVRKYPYDPTGAHPDNSISNEQHELRPDLRIITPREAPFLASSLIVHSPNGILTKGVDYNITDLDVDAVKETGLEWVWSIEFPRITAYETIHISYQCLGKKVVESATILNELIEEFYAEKPVEWKYVLNKPKTFDPSPHSHRADEIYDYHGLIESVNHIADVIGHLRYSKDHEFYTFIGDFISRVNQRVSDVENLMAPALTNVSNLNDLGNRVNTLETFKRENEPVIASLNTFKTTYEPILSDIPNTYLTLTTYRTDKKNNDDDHEAMRREYRGFNTSLTTELGKKADQQAMLAVLNTKVERNELNNIIDSRLQNSSLTGLDQRLGNFVTNEGLQTALNEFNIPFTRVTDVPSFVPYHRYSSNEGLSKLIYNTGNYTPKEGLQVFGLPEVPVIVVSDTFNNNGCLSLRYSSIGDLSVNILTEDGQTPDGHTRYRLVNSRSMVSAIKQDNPLIRVEALEPRGGSFVHYRIPSNHRYLGRGDSSREYGLQLRGTTNVTSNGSINRTEETSLFLNKPNDIFVRFIASDNTESWNRILTEYNGQELIRTTLGTIPTDVTRLKETVSNLEKSVVVNNLNALVNGLRTDVNRLMTNSGADIGTRIDALKNELRGLYHPIDKFTRGGGPYIQRRGKGVDVNEFGKSYIGSHIDFSSPDTSTTGLLSFLPTGNNSAWRFSTTSPVHFSLDYPLVTEDIILGGMQSPSTVYTNRAGTVIEKLRNRAKQTTVPREDKSLSRALEYIDICLANLETNIPTNIPVTQSNVKYGNVDQIAKFYQQGYLHSAGLKLSKLNDVDNGYKINLYQDSALIDNVTQKGLFITGHENNRDVDTAIFVRKLILKNGNTHLDVEKELDKLLPKVDVVKSYSSTGNYEGKVVAYQRDNRITCGGVRFHNADGRTGTLSVDNQNMIVSTATISAPNFWLSSDINFKRDLKPIENALEKVNKITGYTYRFKDKVVRDAGLIAQEVKEILPEAVYQKDEHGMKLSPYATIALLVEAVKELSSKVTQLESEIQKKN